MSVLSKLTPRRLGRWAYYRMLDRAQARLERELPKQVHSGPFAGMAYIRESAGSVFLPKLLGTYEQCLHPEIETILASEPHRVVDVGCAEGYYAVGFADRLPQASVVAYDIDERALALCRQLAEANGVEGRVELRSKCDHEQLNEILEPGSLLVCDCEGFEDELLDPEAVPQLAQTTMLVEVHDCIIPGIGDRLRARFSGSHNLSQASIHPPQGTEVLLKGYPRYLHNGLAGEYRPEGNYFLIARPKVTAAKLKPAISDRHSMQ